MTNTDIIRADRAYGAINGYPEVAGDPIGLIANILRDNPRLDNAACLDHDPDLWFADPSDKTARAQAERICAGCPARTACKDFADASGQEWGIWGGERMTPSNEGRVTHCKNGHEYTTENTIWSSCNTRVCRACETARGGRNRRKAAA